MATPQNVTPRQLELARKALWHQDGEALRTTDSVRTWLNEAGLVPLYPHPQFATPAPSFAEAVLGRPQDNWIPNTKKKAAATAFDESAESSYAVGDMDEDDEDEFADEDEDFDDTDEDDEAGDADEEAEDDEELEEDEPSGEDAEDNGGDDEDGTEGEDGDLEGTEDDEADDENDEDEDEDEPATSEGDEAMLAGDGNIPSDRETMLSNDDEQAEDEGDEIAEEDRIDAAAEEAAPTAEPISGFSPEERETVHRTLARLVEDGSAIPLNLLGSTTGEPDFLVPASAFSFVYTLRGDKNWKAEPATTGPMRVSPLAVKVYEALKAKGAQAPHEITQELGQGITDSATLRALTELWAIQRVIPLPDADGAPAKWELMTGRFVRHLKAGANAGQPTALSALLSLYLSQAVAATSDEMEIFLSPLAARSRVREVVNGLSATRQLEPLVVEGKTLLHIAGALPQLPGDDTIPQSPMAQRSRYEMDDRRASMDERAARGDSASAERRPNSYPVRKPAGARDDRGSRPGFGGGRPAFNRGDRTGGARPAFGDRERRPFTRNDSPRESGGSDRPSFARPWDEERSARPASPRGDRPFTPRDGGERRPFAPRGDGERRPFPPRDGGDRKPFAPRGDRPFTPRADGERRPFTPREGGDRPFAPRGGGERRPFTPREGGERRPFTPREGGERRPFAPRGDRPFTPRGDGERRPFTPRDGGDRKPFAPRGDRPFTPREGGDRERRPFTPRERGERRPFAPRGDRPYTPRAEGERRPFTPRDGGDRERRPFTPRADGERRPFAPRDGGDRKPFAPREDRPFTPRGDRPFTPRGDGERRPFTPREGGDRKPFAPRGDRPFTPRGDGERRGFAPRSGGFDRPNRDNFSGAPGEGRPAFKAGGHSAGPGGSKFGGSGFGRDRGGKPGGFGKPGGRPPFRGPGSGPGRGGAPKRRPE